MTEIGICDNIKGRVRMALFIIFCVVGGLKMKNLVVLDWDKCCNGEGGPGVPWDLEGMADLAETIVKVVKEDIGVCLLTGRGSQYGLAAAEALGLVQNHPGLWSGFEGGLIFAQHVPAWPCEYAQCVQKGYLTARELLEETLTRTIIKQGGRQEKKEVCLTYNPPDGISLDDLLEMAQEFIKDLRLTGLVNATRTNSAVDIWPLGGAKEDNILEICKRNEVDPKDTIYVDDAKSGIPVFNVVGYSGAPANASPEVRQAAKIISKDNGPRGITQIIQYIIWNGNDLGVSFNKV